MHTTAKLRYLHMSPRKVRRVATLISGMPVPHAEAELQARAELAAEPLKKLLKSAIANGTSLTDAKPEQMTVLSCTVTEGPVMKRWRPRSRGMAHPYQKRMSHVSIVLDVPGEKKATEKVEAPIKADEDAKKRAEHVDTDHEAEQKTPTQKGGGRRTENRDAVRGQKQRQNAPRMKRFFQRKSI